MQQCNNKHLPPKTSCLRLGLPGTLPCRRLWLSIVRLSIFRLLSVRRLTVPADGSSIVCNRGKAHCWTSRPRSSRARWCQHAQTIHPGLFHPIHHSTSRTSPLFNIVGVCRPGWCQTVDHPALFANQGVAILCRRLILAKYQVHEPVVPSRGTCFLRLEVMDGRRLSVRLHVEGLRLRICAGRNAVARRR